MSPRMRVLRRICDGMSEWVWGTMLIRMTFSISRDSRRGTLLFGLFLVAWMKFGYVSCKKEINAIVKSFNAIVSEFVVSVVVIAVAVLLILRHLELLHPAVQVAAKIMPIVETVRDQERYRYYYRFLWLSQRPCLLVEKEYWTILSLIDHLHFEFFLKTVWAKV